MEISSTYGAAQGLYSAWTAQMGGDDGDAALSAKIFEDKDTDDSGGLSAQELGLSEDQIQAYDTDGDGVLSESELQAALKAKREEMQARMQSGMEQSAFFGGLQAQMSESDKQAMDAELGSKILADKDTDGDGSLSADEMGLSEDEFNTLDTDGDGLVSQDELTAGLTARRQEFEAGMQAQQGQTAPAQESAEDAASTILADSDSDGDGTVTTSELDAGTSSSISDEIDTNQDGVISTQELEAWLAKHGGESGTAEDDSSETGASTSSSLSQSAMQRAQQAYRMQSDAALAMLFGGDSSQNAVQGQDPFADLSRFLFGDSGSGLSAVA